LSPQYAAPEQWNLEHATSATDIYALGCIAYTLLTGSPPFTGLQREEYRKHHLENTPPALSTIIDPRLRSLVSAMLRKPPPGRPTLDRVLRILGEISSSEPGHKKDDGFGNLAQAGASDAERILHSDAVRAQAERKQKARQELADTAFQILRE